MTRIVHYLTLCSEWLDRAAVFIAKSGMAVMVICIIIQIVARYVFSVPPAWTEELARFAMIWAGLAGATIACRRRLDPALINIRSMKRKSFRMFSSGLETLAILLFCVPIIIASPAVLSLHTERSTDSLMIPSEIVFAIIPISFAVIAFHAVVRLLKEHREDNDTQPEENLI